MHLFGLTKNTGTIIGQKLKVIEIYQETLSKECLWSETGYRKYVICDLRKKSWSEVSIEEAGWGRGGGGKEGGSSM